MVSFEPMEELLEVSPFLKGVYNTQAREDRFAALDLLFSPFF